MLGKLESAGILPPTGPLALLETSSEERVSSTQSCDILWYQGRILFQLEL